MTDKTTFTSNIIKLLGNLENLSIFQKTGVLKPITLDVAPTNKCNQNCSFCSVKNRNKEQELTYEQVIECTNYFYNKGITGIELTGGGEPTMWPYLSQYIQYCVNTLHLKVGLITNGIKLHELSQEVLQLLTFVRVSLNGIDYNWYPNFKIPSNVVFSLNYVWHKDSKLDMIKPLLLKILDKYPLARVLKIQKDVFCKDSIDKNMFDHPRIFVSEKTDDPTPSKCYMGWLKPHLDSDGYIYRCSCSATFNRQFQSAFRIGKLNDVQDKPDADLFSTNRCPYCYFAPQNRFVQQIAETANVEHKEFI